jgi:hypothetical protein
MTVETTETKPRRRGTGRIFQRHQTLWIAYCVDGKERRESAHTGDYDKAERLLNRRNVEAEDRRLPAPAKERKKTVADLCKALEADYAARQCDSAHNLKSVFKPVREAFDGKRASSVTTQDLTDFIVERRSEGYADESISRMLRSLRQAFRLQSALPIPKFPPIPHGKPRDVLIAPAEQRRLLAAMTDPDYRDATEFSLCQRLAQQRDCQPRMEARRRGHHPAGGGKLKKR